MLRHAVCHDFAAVAATAMPRHTPLLFAAMLCYAMMLLMLLLP